MKTFKVYLSNKKIVKKDKNKKYVLYAITDHYTYVINWYIEKIKEREKQKSGKNKTNEDNK